MADNPEQAAASPPDIISLPAFRVLGVRAYCEPEENAVSQLWEGPFMRHHDALKALSSDGRYLGMAWEANAEDGMYYLAGMVVPDDAVAPPELDDIRIPASQWARFTFTMAFQQAGGPEYAHQTWLPSSDWQRNPAVDPVDFAVYQGDTVLFHIPVVAA